MCWQVCDNNMDVVCVVDTSQLFGETCYVWDSRHVASGVGAAGFRSVLSSGLAGPGNF